MQLNPLPPTSGPHASLESVARRGFIGAMPPHIRRLVRKRLEEALSRPDLLEEEDGDEGLSYYGIPLLTKNGRLPVSPFTCYLTQHMIQEIVAGGLHWEPWAYASDAYLDADQILEPDPPPLHSFES